MDKDKRERMSRSTNRNPGVANERDARAASIPEAVRRAGNLAVKFTAPLEDPEEPHNRVERAQVPPIPYGRRVFDPFHERPSDDEISLEQAEAAYEEWMSERDEIPEASFIAGHAKPFDLTAFPEPGSKPDQTQVFQDQDFSAFRPELDLHAEPYVDPQSDPHLRELNRQHDIEDESGLYGPA